jgi:glycosyltransferase involved in cell wall biosynthesis
MTGASHGAAADRPGLRLLLASAIPDDVNSGMGRWTHEVGAALEQAGHSVTLWFADDLPRWARVGRAQFLTAPAAFARMLARRRTAIDVAVVHEPLALWAALARRAGASLPPLVCMCHNVESKVFSVMRAAARRGQARLPGVSTVSTPLLRIPQSDGAIRLADAVACISREDAEWIRGRVRRRSGPVFTVPNGIRSDDLRHRGPRSGGAVALFVGGWLDVKGRRVLPPLWQAVARRMRDARLMLAGTGVEPSIVLADFPPDVRDTVTVVPGRLDRRGVQRCQDEADLLLVPSLSEGAPLALLEAMAAGMPVVATRVGGIPDIVTDGSDGLLFDPARPDEGAAHVLAVFSNAVLATALGASARRTAEGFTWKRTAEGLLAAAYSARDTRRGQP